MNNDFYTIMQRMLQAVPADIDKREGSIIWDALAPAAAEFERFYEAQSGIEDESYPDTCSMANLKRWAAMQAIEQQTASAAICKGEFNKDIPIGSRFSLGSYNYAATEKISTGVYKMTCETAGIDGGNQTGQLIPIQYIDGLTSALLTETLIPGENAETRDALYARYVETFSGRSFAGNVAAYKQYTDTIAGVGGCKVTRAWNGPGTVGVRIIASDFTVPTTELITTVQTALQPDADSDGLGIAPIGHQVTVSGVASVTINVVSTITLGSSASWDTVKDDVKAAIADYLLTLAKSWADADGQYVRVSYVDNAILGVSGVIDVTNTKLNGTAANVELTDAQIPTIGSVTCTA